MISYNPITVLFFCFYLISYSYTVPTDFPLQLVGYWIFSNCMYKPSFRRSMWVFTFYIGGEQNWRNDNRIFGWKLTPILTWSLLLTLDQRLYQKLKSWSSNSYRTKGVWIANQYLKNDTKYWKIFISNIKSSFN